VRGDVYRIFAPGRDCCRRSLRRSPEDSVRELLRRTRRRHVLPLQNTNRAEVWSKPGDEGCRVISLDEESTALFGTTRTECRHHDVTTDSYRPPQRGQVRLLIDGSRQKVEHGPVVPQVHLFRQLQGPRIRDEPCHRITSRPQTRAGTPEGGIGNVDHCDAAKASPQQMVNQTRGTSTDVNDAALLRQRNCAY
jgi:hypothetical protein